MKRFRLAALVAVLLAPLNATVADAQRDAAWFDHDQPTTTAADGPVRRVAFLDRVFANVRDNCGCQAPSCVTPGCATMPGCAAPAGCCKNKCSSGLIPAMCRMRRAAVCSRCARPNCTGCAAPRCRVGFQGDYDTGSCISPNCCGETSCHNYWHNYCNERPLLAVMIRSNIARRRAYCNGIGMCAGLGCPISGASNCCSIPGCTSAPGGTPPQSPFLDDPDSPPLPPIPTSSVLHGMPPHRPGYLPVYMPQSPVGLSPSTGLIRGGLRPTPAHPPLLPPKRQLMMRPVRPIYRAQYTEPVEAAEANGEIAPPSRSQAATEAVTESAFAPVVDTETNPATESRPSLRSRSDSQAVAFPAPVTTSEPPAQTAPRWGRTFALGGASVEVLANGARMVHNPYVPRELAPPAEPPRRLLPVQQDGEQMNAAYPRTSAAPFAPVKQFAVKQFAVKELAVKEVAPASASKPIEPASAEPASKASAVAPVSAEIRSLPAVIRFITPAHAASK